MPDVDPDDADDLVQEALIKLWEIEPARFEERDDPYVRTVLIRRMREVRREEAKPGGRGDPGIHVRFP